MKSPYLLAILLLLIAVALAPTMLPYALYLKTPKGLILQLYYEGTDAIAPVLVEIGGTFGPYDYTLPRPRLKAVALGYGRMEADLTLKIEKEEIYATEWSPYEKKWVPLYSQSKRAESSVGEIIKEGVPYIIYDLNIWTTFNVPATNVIPEENSTLRFLITYDIRFSGETRPYSGTIEGVVFVTVVKDVDTYVPDDKAQQPPPDDKLPPDDEPEPPPPDDTPPDDETPPDEPPDDGIPPDDDIPDYDKPTDDKIDIDDTTSKDEDGASTITHAHGFNYVGFAFLSIGVVAVISLIVMLFFIKKPWK